MTAIRQKRYDLFTIIVLGESILAATVAVQSAVDADEAGGALFGVAAGGLLIVFAMWWLYFARSAHRFLVSNRVSFVWGYGHFFVFAAAAAVGAGLAATFSPAPVLATGLVLAALIVASEVTGGTRPAR